MPLRNTEFFDAKYHTLVFGSPAGLLAVKAAVKVNGKSCGGRSTRTLIQTV